MTPRASISWRPSWADPSAFQPFHIGSLLSCEQPCPQGWKDLELGLRRAAFRLREMSIREIVAAIDAVAQLWCDRDWPLRVQARERAAQATGFSEQAVDRSFDVELRNYRADSLWRTLNRELGDPRVLDGFRGNQPLDGLAHAIGPEITGAIFTGNVPGLPALSIVRALLVKSAVIAKVASGEPTFAALFAQSLHAADARLGDAIVVTYWDREDTASRDALFACVDALIAYGGEDACAAIRAALPPGLRYVEHGHKFSAGIVSEPYVNEHGLDKVAERIAADVSLFNQQACIAPQAYLIVGSEELSRDLGRGVAHALAQYAEGCPLGTLDLQDAASLQLRRADAAWRASTSPESEVWVGESLDWTVSLSSTLGAEGGGNRFLRLVSTPTIQSALDVLRPIGPHLQNVGLGVAEPELTTVALELARLGACRISAPGRMAEPSLMWKHDGHSCVAELVRWCDIEMYAEPADR